MFHDDVFEAAFELEEADGVFAVVASQGVGREALSGFLGVGFEGFGGVGGDEDAGFFAVFAFLVDLVSFALFLFFGFGEGFLSDLLGFLFHLLVFQVGKAVVIAQSFGQVNAVVAAFFGVAAGLHGIRSVI